MFITIYLIGCVFAFLICINEALHMGNHDETKRDTGKNGYTDPSGASDGTLSRHAFYGTGSGCAGIHRSFNRSHKAGS